MARIGFIGLGNMGLPMAQNLIKAGHQVEGVDVNPASVEKLKAAGGAGVETAKSAAARADVVITMLPAGKQVREVYLGSSGIIENANPGTLLIDCSTIDVDTARAVAAEAEKKGLLMLDAPVSGGVGGATGGDAYIHGRRQRAGVHARRIDLAEDGQDHRARGRRRQRPGGQDLQQHDPRRVDDRGREAFVLAEKLGLDHQKLFDISSKSSGQCWSMTSYCPGAGTGADIAGQSRLSGRLHRGDDAQGSEVGAGGSKGDRSQHRTRRGSGADLFKICGERRGVPRFFRHHPFHSRLTRTSSVNEALLGFRIIVRSRDRSPLQINLIFMVLFKPILDCAS